MRVAKADLIKPLMASLGLLSAALQNHACAQTTATAAVSVGIRVEPFAEIKFPDGFDFYLWVPDDRHDPIWPAVIPFKIRGNARASVTAIPDAFLKVHHGPWLGKAVRIGHDGHGHGWDWDWHGWDHWGWDDWGHNNHHGAFERDRLGGRGRQEHDRPGGARRGPVADFHGGTHGGGSGPTELGYNAIVRFPVITWSDVNLPPWSGFGTGINGNRLASLPGLNGVGTPELTADVAGYEHGRLGLIFIASKPNWTANGQNAEPGKYRGALQVTVTADEP